MAIQYSKGTQKFINEYCGKVGEIFLNEIILKNREDAAKEIIICSAIKIESLIIRGHRHNNCNDTAKRMKINRLRVCSAIQGFITSKNRFVDRAEAYKLQRAARLPSVNRGGYDVLKKELYSEDLY